MAMELGGSVAKTHIARARMLGVTSVTPESDCSKEGLDGEGKAAKVQFC